MANVFCRSGSQVAPKLLDSLQISHKGRKKIKIVTESVGFKREKMRSVIYKLIFNLIHTRQVFWKNSEVNVNPS